MVQDDMYWIFLKSYLLDTNPTKSIDALSKSQELNDNLSV